MSRPIEEWAVVEAEVRVPAATAQLLQLYVTDPSDLVMMERNAYWLDMCLTPRPRNTRLCYRDHWLSHRFERLGKVFLLPPGEAVQIRSDGGPEQLSILCHLRPEILCNGSGQELDWTERGLAASLDIAAPHVHYLLRRLAEEMRHPGFANELLVELIAAQLAIELGRYFVSFEEIPPPGELAPWRLRLIDERLQDVSEIPRLSDLASLCHLSVRQLARGLRATRGCSIGDYVAQKRIEHAKHLLAGEQSVKAIAYGLGFSSPSAFCFAFRRATGMTPGEFRASARALAHRPGT